MKINQILKKNYDLKLLETTLGNDDKTLKETTK